MLETGSIQKQETDIIKAKLASYDSSHARGIEGPLDLKVYVLDTEQIKNTKRSTIFLVMNNHYVTVSLCDTALQNKVDFALEFDSGKFPEMKAWMDGVCGTSLVKLGLFKKKSDVTCGCSADLMRFFD